MEIESKCKKCKTFFKRVDYRSCMVNSMGLNKVDGYWVDDNGKVWASTDLDLMEFKELEERKENCEHDCKLKGWLDSCNVCTLYVEDYLKEIINIKRDEEEELRWN